VVHLYYRRAEVGADPPFAKQSKNEGNVFQVAK
jgi:hypothetical protein